MSNPKHVQICEDWCVTVGSNKNGELAWTSNKQ